METIEVQCDLKAGTFKISGDKDSVSFMLDKLSVILERFFRQGPMEATLPATSSREGRLDDEAPEPKDGAASPPPPKAPDKFRRGSSAGKAPNYQLINIIESEDKKGILRRYFAEISPKSQNDIVAVLCVKAKELTGKESFNMNDVFSLCRMVGVKVPRNLSAVFGNMRVATLGGGGGGEFAVTWLTEDHVKALRPKVPE